MVEELEDVVHGWTADSVAFRAHDLEVSVLLEHSNLVHSGVYCCHVHYVLGGMYTGWDVALINSLEVD